MVLALHILKNKKLWKRFNLSNVANVAGAGTRNKTLSLDAKFTFFDSGPPLYTGVEDTRYLSISMVRKARRNDHCDPPELGDIPPTSELLAPFVTLTNTTTAAAVAVTTQLWPRGRHPAIL